ncbi:hypothetical protein [Pyrobaculum aerophilum]|nr:hypothetical protein [Pyrobaculum aerophilum]
MKLINEWIKVAHRGDGGA